MSPVLYNFDYFQIISWFDCYQFRLDYPSVEQCWMRNVSLDTSQIIFDILYVYSWYILNQLHKAFLHFSFIFTFLKILNKISGAENLEFFFNNTRLKILQFWHLKINFIDMKSNIIQSRAFFFNEITWNNANDNKTKKTKRIFF